MSVSYILEPPAPPVKRHGGGFSPITTKSEAARLRLLNPTWHLKAIAKELGVSRERIRQVLTQQGLPTSHLKLEQYRAPRCVCGRVLALPSRKATGLCRECDLVKVTCQQCGTERIVTRHRAQNKQYFCDRHCFGRWIGKHRKPRRPKQVIKTRSGYLQEYAPGHPRANRKGYVFQHILVWERSSGQKPPDSCVVHHLNGNKSDNRPGNLVALPIGRHHPYLVQRALRKRIRELEECLSQLRMNLYPCCSHGG